MHNGYGLDRVMSEVCIYYYLQLKTARPYPPRLSGTRNWGVTEWLNLKRNMDKVKQMEKFSLSQGRQNA